MLLKQHTLDGWTALGLAATNGHWDVVSILLENLDNENRQELGRTPQFLLKAAIEQQQIEVLEKLLSDFSSEERLNLLKSEDEHRDLLILFALNQQRRKAFACLLHALSPVHRKALMIDQVCGGPRIVRKIIQDKDIVTFVEIFKELAPDDCISILHEAAGCSREGFLSGVLSWLLDAASICVRAPLVSLMEDLVERLITGLGNKRLLILHTPVAEDAGQVQVLPPDLLLPLMSAAIYGRPHIIKKMLEGLTELEHFALLRRISKKGNTALHIAVKLGGRAAVEALLEGLSPAMRKAVLLTDSEQDKAGPVWIATDKGMLGVVVALLDLLPLADKKLIILQKYGVSSETALDAARRAGHADIVALFESYLQAEEPGAEAVHCEVDE